MEDLARITLVFEYKTRRPFARLPSFKEEVTVVFLQPYGIEALMEDKFARSNQGVTHHSLGIKRISLAVSSSEFALTRNRMTA